MSLFHNKRGGSSGIPREIYIFSIITIYIVFGLLYLAFGNTMTDIHNAYTLDNGTSVNLDNPLLPDETSGLLEFVKSGFTGFPDWINWVFALMSAMILLLIVIVILHG